MADNLGWGAILQDSTTRAIVQENLLTCTFNDALFPALIYRNEVEDQDWPDNVGDDMIFTGDGLIAPKMRALAPNADPAPSTFSREQWEATLRPYGDMIPIHLPSSQNAIASLLLDNAKTLGMSGAQSLNRIVRNNFYNAAMSGNTLCDGGQGPTSTLSVKWLNGFTRARRPDLAAGSAVRFSAVSASNPLKVVVTTTTGPSAVTVTGFSPTTPGDEIGPGTLTLSGNVTVNDRAAVVASDGSTIVRVGGGATDDALTSANLFTYSSIRSAVASMRQNVVPTYPDGSYHIHLDPKSEDQIFGDFEFQRLQQGVPDSLAYKNMVIKYALGLAFFRNEEAPTPESTTWAGNTDGTFSGQAFTQDDPFAGEVWNASGVGIHKPLIIGYGGLKEYTQPIEGAQTVVGLNGKMVPAKIVNGGLEVMARGIKMIFAAPVDALQQMVRVSWYYRGAWAFRTDSATGGLQRNKRVMVVSHGS